MKALQVTLTASSVLLFLFLLGSASTANAEEIFPTAVLTASDGVSGDDFGTSVAFSGNTLVVGSIGSAGNGAAYVFINSGGLWTQVAKLTASDGVTGSQFGFSVGISGNTVAVGAPMQSGGGAVYVFVKPGGGWADTTQTAKLAYGGQDFGYCVAVGGGGSFVLMGAFFASTAYVFVEPAGGWANMIAPTATLVTPPNSGAFGTAIAVSGTTAVVGAHTTNNGNGAAYVFPLSPGTASINSVAALTPSDGNGDDFMGGAVAINGNTVVAGGTGHDQARGAVYIFVEPTTGWTDMTQTAELTVNAGGGTALGAGVEISNEAIVAGAPSGAFSAVLAYLKPASGWANSSAPNAWGTPSVRSASFGEAVALEGTTAAVGASDVNLGQGAVYIFQ